jgi:formate dehydrogenase subunit gamma
MEILRRGQNPWGQDIIIGLGWSVFWLVVVLGAMFVVLHAIARRKSGAGVEPSGAELAAAPARVVRHGRSARVSHWILAASVLVLLVTSFVPIFGLKFPWVTIHWLSGLVLTLYVVFHTFDTLKRGSLASMLSISGEELKEGIARARGKGSPSRPGKWGVENKVFHHLTGLAGVGVVATGLLMMFRVDTWLWNANPYILSRGSAFWGWVYTLHGLTAVGFVGLLIAHIYLAARPDNWWITRSMFKGWITGREYVQHHDPALWPAEGSPAVGETSSREPLGAPGAD